MRKFLWLVLLLGGCGCETGTGEATGYVVSIQKSGIVWRTTHLGWKSDTESSNTRVVCVEDDGKLVDALREFGRTRERVRVEYRSLWFSDWWWNCSSDEGFRVFKVEKLK